MFFGEACLIFSEGVIEYWFLSPFVHFLKEVKHQTSKPLWIPFNKSLTVAKSLTNWKCVSVSPFFKKGQVTTRKLSTF